VTDRIDPHRPKQLEPETAEDNPPGTLEEVAPTAPEDCGPDDLPTNPHMEPDMTGGVPLAPGGPDKPVPPMTQDDLPREEPEKAITPF